ncbi:MAG TPA: outer membrane lipoprotein carrier protein LolA [Chthoniobacter sp.]|nr:outer membrane lipoprotein carrier protein LolA [Chthoniobacter sp.]
MRLLIPFLTLLCALPALAAEPIDMAPVKKWIARQDELRSVQADFTQTRALRALRSPIATPGHMAFATPDQLRWELGEPAKTIVIRKGDTYTLIQPAKKKAERYKADSIAKKGGAMGFAMMNFPLAKDFADFNRQFETLAVTVTDNRCHLELLPRDAQAKKMLEALKFDFDTVSGHLLSFELTTRDGSSMRSDFSNVRMNQKIDRHVFDYDLTGYEVVDGKN